MQATVYKHGQLITLMGYGRIDPEKQANQIYTFKPFWTRWKCHLMTEENMADLIQAIYNGQAVAVSDGTFKDQAGAVAWMIEGHMAEHQLLGTGLTPGHPDDQSAYWSELF